MNRLSQLIDGRDQVVFDGAIGTLLQERGLRWRCRRAVERRQPGSVRDIHEQYAAAGATFLTTNTFGGTRPRLDLQGLATGSSS